MSQHPAVYAMAYSALVINSIKVGFSTVHLFLARRVTVSVSHACALVFVNNWLLRFAVQVVEAA
jgi:hypothetical protein